MVTILSYSGDDSSSSTFSSGARPFSSAREEHPIAVLFKKVTGQKYYGSSNRSLIPDDSYHGDMGYLPSVADLTIGLQWLYELVHGTKPRVYPSSPPASSAEDRAAAKKAGQEMVLSIEDALGHPVRFLELGAGVAFNTIQASELGMEVYAIELRMPLVVIAQKMLAVGRTEGVLSPNAHVTIVHGNYFPKDILVTLEPDSGFLLDNPYTAHGKDAYDILGRGLADFQLLYSYPWPNKEDSPFFRQFLATSTHAPCVWQTPTGIKMIYDAEGPYFLKKRLYFDMQKLSRIRLDDW